MAVNSPKKIFSEIKTFLQTLISYRNLNYCLSFMKIKIYTDRFPLVKQVLFT